MPSLLALLEEASRSVDFVGSLLLQSEEVGDCMEKSSLLGSGSLAEAGGGVCPVVVVVPSVGIRHFPYGIEPRRQYWRRRLRLREISPNSHTLHTSASDLR